MATLQEIYASKGEIPLIEAIQINCSAWPSIYLVKGYVDKLLYVPEEDQFILHQSASVGATKPSRDNRANQVVQIVVDNVLQEVRKRISEANKARARIEIQLRTYLATDLSTPASRTLTADVKSAEISGTEARLEAGFFPVYDTNFNRIIYDSRTAKALKYDS